MILTITMNPAVDKTMHVDDFRINDVNREQQSRLDAAGKGINVSKVVKELGGRTKTFAFLGGETGDYIRTELEAMRIPLVSVRTDHATRTNLKIVDLKNKTYTDINEKGGVVSQQQLEAFEKHLFNYVTSQTLVVFTGSVPPGVPWSIYANLIKRVQSLGAKTVLDADGELLSHAIKSGPTLVKPNISELERLAGRPLTTHDDIIEACQVMLDHGTELVVVSLGQDGALFVKQDLIIHARGLKVQVAGTVGAGDALVGALCYGMYKQLPYEEVVKLALATSAAKVTVPGTQAPSLEIIYPLKQRVTMTKLRGDQHES